MTDTEGSRAVPAASGPDWEADCIKWRGRVLTGAKAHWCYDWDFLPVDETTEEIEACSCLPPSPSNREDGRKE